MVNGERSCRQNDDSGRYSCDLFGIADCYEGLIDGLLIDQQDRAAMPDLNKKGLDLLATDILMYSRENKVRVAETLVHLYKNCNSTQPLRQAV